MQSRKLMAENFERLPEIGSASCCQASYRRDGANMANLFPAPCCRARQAVSKAYFFCIEHVLKPNSAYGGQNPKAPVSNGTTPIQPHTPICPANVSPTKVNPAKMRTMRSIPPTLCFMMFSLKKKLRLKRGAAHIL